VLTAFFNGIIRQPAVVVLAKEDCSLQGYLKIDDKAIQTVYC
jgi:hypothetical protein